MRFTDARSDHRGLLFIGDPHLESRIPGFRKDDFPQVALDKFRWCLKYAVDHELQPFLLGDLFQLPQDNPNWLISSIIEIISTELNEPLPAIHGNHDVRENTLKPNDSIHILFASGQLRAVSATEPWIGDLRGHRVVVGGTSWSDQLPKRAPDEFGERELTVWMTHHDILIPGYEEGGRMRPSELPGIDLIVNGHIHRRLETVSKGSTHWMTPGNITRRTRGDASRAHRPSVLCVGLRSADNDTHTGDIDGFDFDSRGGTSWQAQWVTVPHASFDEVFHPQLDTDPEAPESGSAFVAYLRELTARRTDTGAGLADFLDQHLPSFDNDVADEIRRLAAEVTAK